MIFTVIGGKGFVGGAVVQRLQADGHEVFVPERDDKSIVQRKLGHVIYAAGVTADFLAGRSTHCATRWLGIWF